MLLDNGREDINHLLEKFHAGTCSEEELRILYHYYNIAAEQQDLCAVRLGDTRKIEASIWQEIQENCDCKTPITSLPSRTRRKTYIGVAAACLAFGISIAAWLFFFSKPSTETYPILSGEIQPGRTEATLILGDGRKIYISDSTFIDAIADANMSISRDEQGILKYQQSSREDVDTSTEYNTLSTSRGQTISIILSDNSKVWLNADSRISYPANMNVHDRREIRLVGEAFFQVERDESRPFIVHSDLGSVEVKGTQFNVNAYPDIGKVVTTVTEGRVEVRNRHEQSVQLTANQQATIDRYKIEKNDYVDTELFSSWKDGYFTFQGSMEDLLVAIAKWYNVEVAPIKDPKHLVFYGKISRNQSLEKVMNILSSATGLEFKVENRTITTK